MKKSLAFIVCLALLVSSVFIGSFNAADSKSDAAYLTTGSFDMASDDSLGRLSAGATNLPTLSTEAGSVSNIEKKSDTLYELKGNATVSADDAALLAEIEAVLNAGGTLDGKGYTLTTTVNGPLFSTLKGNGTIKNIVVDGDIQGSSAEHGVFTVKITGEGFNFDTVLLTATLTRGGSTGGFVGAIEADTTFTNCEFAGTVKGFEGTGGYGGGFAVLYQNNANVTFTNCTSSGTVNFGANIGGFIGSARAGSVTITGCKSTATLDSANTVKGNGGKTANGSAGFIAKINDTTYSKLVKIENSVAEPTFVVGETVGRSLGGFIGFVLRTGNDATGGTQGIYINNCESDCTLDVADGYADNGDLSAFGGFIGRVTNHDVNQNRSVKIVNSTNYTEIDWNKPSMSATIKYGGIIGSVGFATGFSTVTEITNCVNKGDVSITAAATSKLIAGGCIGAGEVDTLTVSGFINLGDITLNCAGDDTTGSAIASGAIANATGGILADSVINAGDITVATKGEAKASEFTGSGDKLNCTNLGSIVENGETVNAPSTTAFVTDATMAGGLCTSKVSKAFYDVVKAIAEARGETIEFGAIITLQNYVTKIGEFNHENFNAYYAANKAAIDAKAEKELGRLYEIAKFNKEGQTSLTDGELSGDNYVVPVKLADAGNYTYVARTFIKIGSLYIYSK